MPASCWLSVSVVPSLWTGGCRIVMTDFFRGPPQSRRVLHCEFGVSVALDDTACEVSETRVLPADGLGENRASAADNSAAFHSTPSQRSRPTESAYRHP